MNALAEQHDCLVAWPAQSQGANASRCWSWFNVRDQQRDAGEPAILAGLVRGIVRSHAVDPRRIYVGGLSAGGAMAVILGATYPDLFAAVGVHSGLPYGAAHDMSSAFAAMKHAPQGRGRGLVQPLPTIVFHGDADATVHPRNGERIMDERGESTIDTLAGAAPGGHEHTRRLYRDVEGKVLAEHWLVQGASHPWSGGDPRGTYTDARGPDASKEMLRFFLERENAASGR